jgi:RNA polymerase-binding transcription factor DksA
MITITPAQRWRPPHPTRTRRYPLFAYSEEQISVMADDRSVHTHLQHYTEHLNRLEELRELLDERLAATDPVLDHAAARRISDALDRMDRGLYGICECCGIFIPFDQLLQAPDRTACASCSHVRREEAAA